MSLFIHWRMMITLALTTGLRRGELVALEWKHINLEAGTIEVKQSISSSVNGSAIIQNLKQINQKERLVSLIQSVIN
ncbi:tyrosine-type recombinase/integrase [Brevibacillus laterosporus]|uniref:Tyrosine-type recombinase/integrase n=1 Tax=Brevibacillus laterosporus TaxID=1465 RepID=A0AAP3GCL4_BRELA|nr:MULTISPECIES: tyrosine-type recombinase/integrase [Brevibacillus]MCR8938070.1 tyrosine-type recombinase/integrase [Brevibacillus laterosporus]MCR8982831.1 tyrosine-type recombinase/integrase [Brevibacillus laterosporus]MCZ0809987.1 tyrosine-type recombinase/integrase [Brevibacillus laterosporus]MCZ0828601.1 tyrosine-type recombinase/integrase [Brevibacillus laterosporus]MCZ0840710.1 tyrosine-type recombinase/integrase [Brevibacillus laterosporus]